MSEMPMRFRFKGTRDYVHGTDLYNQMTGALADLHDLSSCAGLRLSIRSFARHHGVMTVGPEGTPEKGGAVACTEMSVVLRGGPLVARLFETSEPVTERYAYDEGKIEKLATVEGPEIRIAQDCGYTPIEVAVALTKQLHHRLFPSAPGKWVFSRLELARPFRAEDAARLAIRLKHDSGNRLTRSEVRAGDAPLGQIYFSVKR